MAMWAPAALADDVPSVKIVRPDFSGVWTNASLTPLSRARGVANLVVSKEEADRIAKSTAVAGVAPEEAGNEDYVDPNLGAPEKGGRDFGLKGYNSFWVAPGETLAVVKGEYRTSNIVDPPNGQLPYKDPAGVAKAQAAGFIRYVTGNDPYEGPEATALSERCLIGFGGTGGPGMLSVLYNNTYQFVQTPDHLMILVEMAHDARIIPIFEDAGSAKAGHKPNVIKPWLGDSVGWWEGATLVVETINVHPLQAAANPFPLSAKAKVTERFSRAADSEIFYEFKVDDPDSYTQPWKAELSFHPAKGGLYEYACHEGNYGLFGILAGARQKEREAAQAKASR
jgi:hypothetical protein